MSHKQFTEKDIYSIEIYKKEWFSHNKIALKLNKHHTSVDRLVKKYKSHKTWIFYASQCIKDRKKLRSTVNRNNKNRIKSSTLKLYILKKIKKYFRRKWKKYQHKRRERYSIKDRKMINTRPNIIETRERIWDWEWDTVIWLRWWSKEVILTNVDRKSWYLLAKKIKDKTWNSVLEWTIDVFKNIPKYKKLTMTYDNWREFCEHRAIEYFTNLDVYFAEPYSSRQRWSNENTNWLIRQFAPKKTAFEKITQNQLKYYISLINFRPRKRLNYRTPHEVFFDK